MELNLRSYHLCSNRRAVDAEFIQSDGESSEESYELIVSERGTHLGLNDLI